MKKLALMFAIVLWSVIEVCWPHVVQGEICNRVVAIVNNDIITLYELNARIKEITGLDPSELKSRGENIFYETRKKLLDLLIDEKIAQEKIRELGIQVTPEQVDAAIEKIKMDNHLTREDLTDRLHELGISYEKYRENIRKDLEKVRLINLEVKSKIIIREEDIKRYYEEHKEDFADEEKFHLATIFLKYGKSSALENARSTLSRAKEILGRLRNGEDFPSLARTYSQGPGAGDGGDLGFFKETQLDPDLLKVVTEMPVGGVSAPIERPSGVQIVKLVEKQEAEVKALEDVTDAIYAILYREEVNKKYSVWIRELREKAYMKIVL